jgi:hypothetical protein
MELSQLVLSNSQMPNQHSSELLSHTIDLCIYFSESSEDESSEPPRKRLCSTFTLDGTGNVMSAQFNQKNNTDTKLMFVCFQLMKHILLICICFSESSADESSKPTRKRLHSTFTLDGTGNVMNAKFNQKNSTNMKSVFVWFQ